MEVRVHGAVGLYEARGEYQMNVRRLEAVGEEGLFRQAFEKLKAQLDAEGLLDPARKRPVPRMPITVGVVTSTTGAALRDILTVIRRRAPWTRVVVMGSRVQGVGAGREVARAVRTLAESGRIDTLIVGRGGGSIEDLWAFNEEPVALAVAASPVPVISAVGHETDVTISDLVADLRAPTPSAAAEAAVPDGAAMAEWLAGAPPRLETALELMVRRRREAVARGLPRLRRAVRVLLDPRRRRVAEVGERLPRALRDLVERRRRSADVRARLVRAMEVAVASRRRLLAGMAGRLDALSPLATLERGYAVPLTEEGRVLRGVDDFAPGRTFHLRVADGRVGCRTDEIIARDEEAS